MWGEVVKEMGTILGGTAILVWALTYLAKKLLTHWMDKDVQKHKASLEATNAIELEKIRADLRQRAIEHELQFRRNDEKVAERLDEIYRRLLDFHGCLKGCVEVLESPGEPSKQEKLDATRKANREFWDYFKKNRLYVPRDLFAKTEAVAVRFRHIMLDFETGLQGQRDGIKKDLRFWSKAYKEAREEASPIFSVRAKRASSPGLVPWLLRYHFLG